jgi:solute:Na+ symporter, SSS family
MEPTLATLDYVIIAVYMVFSVGVGIYFSKKASSSTDDYFVGGRAMPWWLIGTSMVATTFASDTPLAMTEMVREHGLWRNWFWWNACIAQIMAVFLFARLWRRARASPRTTNYSKSDTVGSLLPLCEVSRQSTSR